MGESDSKECFLCKEVVASSLGRLSEALGWLCRVCEGKWIRIHGTLP